MQMGAGRHSQCLGGGGSVFGTPASRTKLGQEVGSLQMRKFQGVTGEGDRIFPQGLFKNPISQWS